MRGTAYPCGLVVLRPGLTGAITVWGFGVPVAGLALTPGGADAAGIGVERCGGGHLHY